MKSLLCCFLVLIFFLIGCDTDKPTQKKKTIAGHQVLIEIVSGTAESSASSLIKKAFKQFEERILIIDDAESELTRLNRERGPLPVSSEFEEMLNLVSDLQKTLKQYWQPFFGEPKALWQIDSKLPVAPDAELLTDAIKKASQTEIIMESNGNAQLSGDGILDPGWGAVGWAIDGSADLLINAGVEAGKVEVDGLHRFWGSPDSDEDDKWAFKTESPPSDGSIIEYIIKPPDGALAVLNIADQSFKYDGNRCHKVLNPENGIPLSEPFGSVIWTKTAMSAAAYAEAMLIMGRSDAFYFVDSYIDIAIFYIYPNDEGYAAEANHRMTPWLDVHVP